MFGLMASNVPRYVDVINFKSRECVAILLWWPWTSVSPLTRGIIAVLRRSMNAWCWLFIRSERYLGFPASFGLLKALMQWIR
jgi:hypothetical protein